MCKQVLTASGTNANCKRASCPDSGILQCLGSVGMALAKATRALARHVTFLHHSASLQRAVSRSGARQKHCILEEFSLSGIKTKVKVQPKFFKFFVSNPCQSSPSLAILVPSRFIIMSLVCFYLRELLFSGFIQTVFSTID